LRWWGALEHRSPNNPAVLLGALNAIGSVLAGLAAAALSPAVGSAAVS
jgi:hypothetical protein